MVQLRCNDIAPPCFKHQCDCKKEKMSLPLLQTKLMHFYKALRACNQLYKNGKTNLIIFPIPFSSKFCM